MHYVFYRLLSMFHFRKLVYYILITSTTESQSTIPAPHTQLIDGLKQNDRMTG